MPKGQLISKAKFQAEKKKKKRTNEFAFFASLEGKSNFGKYFVRFFGESRTSNFAFEIN